MDHNDAAYATSPRPKIDIDLTGYAAQLRTSIRTSPAAAVALAGALSPQPSDWPQPPPPGVRIVTTDPAASSRPALGGSRTPSTSLRPTAPGPPPAAPRGALPAAVGEQRQGGLLKHPDRAHQPRATGMPTSPGGGHVELVAFDPHRVLQLQGFDRGVQGVGHAHVHTGRPRPARGRALATGERLVVRPPPPADDQIVHRALSLRGQDRAVAGPALPGPVARRGPTSPTSPAGCVGCAGRDGLGQGRQHRVGDPLGRLDVAGDHGGRPARVHQGSGLRQYLQRGVGAVVRRNVLGQQHPQRETAGRPGDRPRAVHVAGHRR